MSVIHVRSIPDELATRLQAQAKRHHRSMEAEVRSILAEAIQPLPVTRAPRHVNFDLIAKMNLGDLAFEPMSPSLREVEL